MRLFDLDHTLLSGNSNVSHPSRGDRLVRTTATNRHHAHATGWPVIHLAR
jgi:hypothetical protein